LPRRTGRPTNEVSRITEVLIRRLLPGTAYDRTKTS
jgi:hypothetical protein